MSNVKEAGDTVIHSPHGVEAVWVQVIEDHKLLVVSEHGLIMSTEIVVGRHSSKMISEVKNKEMELIRICIG